MAQPDLDWSAPAVADLLTTLDFISDENPVAAQALKDEIERKTSLLPDHPHIFRKGRVVGTREMLVRTNYLVVYTEAQDSIRILRVLHAARTWP